METVVHVASVVLSLKLTPKSEMKTNRYQRQLMDGVEQYPFDTCCHTWSCNQNRQILEILGMMRDTVTYICDLSDHSYSAKLLRPFISQYIFSYNIL